MTLESQILDHIEKHAYEILHFASQLIQIPSLTGSEGRIQKFIAQELQALGFDLDIWEPDLELLKSHPEFQQIPDDYHDRPNVVGTLKGKGGGKSIILNGHVDVVPVEPFDKWLHGGPWGGEVDDEKLYGRGSSDMKSGLACFIQAVKMLRESNIKLLGDIIIESVVDEERGGNGTLAAVLRGYKADGAIIGEPTNMDIITENAGALWVRITVTGKAAHGAYKYNGVNAIEKAMYIYDHLLAFEKERQERLKSNLFAHYSFPFPLNIGSFHSGDWPSSVPDRAIMEGRVGFAPSEDHNEFRREFEDYVSKVAKNDAWLAEYLPQVEWFGLFMDSARIDAFHPLVVLSKQTMEEIIRRPVELKGKAGGTDMRLLINSGTPCIQIGPGLSSEAHTVNESASTKNIIDVTKTIALILMRFCSAID
jgi:acetylornithine deacetylase